MKTHDSLQFSTAHHGFLCWTKRFHFSPCDRHLLKIHITFVTSTSRFSKLLFLSGFVTIAWNCLSIGSIRTARPAHHFLLSLPNIMRGRQEALKMQFSLTVCLPFPQNKMLSAALSFSNAGNRCPSLKTKTMFHAQGWNCRLYVSRWSG